MRFGRVFLRYFYEFFDLQDVQCKINRIIGEENLCAKKQEKDLDCNEDLAFIKNLLSAFTPMNDKKKMLIDSVPQKYSKQVCEWITGLPGVDESAFIEGLPKIIFGLIKKFVEYEGSHN